MGVDRRLSGRKKRSLRRKKEFKPKIVEDPRGTLVFFTKKSSPIVRSALRDIHQIKKPRSLLFTKKNDVLPFNNITPVEFLCEKNNKSLFCCGTHSKKRPNNLILGRLYDSKLLDMVEFGIEDFKALTTNVKITSQYGSKPCLLFQGAEFVNSEAHKIIKNILVDFFRGEEIDKINITGVDHVIVITSHVQQLYFRHYCIEIGKKTEKSCDVNLVSIGPSMTWKLRRNRFASKDLRQLSLRKPKELMPGKNRNKNIYHNPLGEKMGRIHIRQQPIQQLSLKKFGKSKKDRRGKKKN